MTDYSFNAYVSAALFDRSGQAVFALGDGTVRFEDGTVIEAHPDAGALCAAPHPSGEGIVTGGDDGRLAWTRASGAKVLAEAQGCWIEAVAVSAVSGLIAFTAGKEARVVSVADTAFARTFAHETSVSGLAFDPKGLKLAAATYGGAAVWYARIAQQKPLWLKWAGIHTDVFWSPDGKFLISALQDAQLHGWRLSDNKDMRMGGYPAKVKSMAFMSNGMILATSGAHGVVLWPFTGPSGPMGREAAEVAYDEQSRVVRVACAGAVVAGGREDGRLFALTPTASRVAALREQTGAPITALALSPDGRRAAWGDEDGAAGVIDLPALA
jgi:WD40 repeat protein